MQPNFMTDYKRLAAYNALLLDQNKELTERCGRLEVALRACDAVLANLGCDEDNSPRAEVKDILGESP